MGIDASNVLEVSSACAGGSSEAKCTLVWVYGAHADPVPLCALAQHDAHAFICFLFAELLDAFGDLSWSIYVQETLVPWPRIEGLVYIAPLAEMGDGRGVYLLVELCAAIVLDTVFNGGDNEDKEDGNGSGGSRGGAKDGKDCGVLGGVCGDRDGLTLEYDEGQKVNVGYATKRGQLVPTRGISDLTGGIAQRGSWVGKSVGYILETVRWEREKEGGERTAGPYFVSGVASEWLAVLIDLYGGEWRVDVYISALTGYCCERGCV